MALIGTTALLLEGRTALRCEEYPVFITGVWGSQAISAEERSEAQAQTACETFQKGRQWLKGEILTFKGDQKASYGGYADFVDTNISVKRVGDGEWEIVDNHYEDGEDGGRARFVKDKYRARVKGNVLNIFRDKTSETFSRCNVGPSTSPSARLQFLGGDCKVQIDTADLGCSGSAVQFSLENGRTLINFPTRDIAAVGFAGGRPLRTGPISRVLWVDRAYLNQSVQPADGQCSLAISKMTENAVLECRVILRDGRRLMGTVATEKNNEQFLAPPEQNTR